ncbi:hypothetical protein GCM10027284_20110 [Cyclobacterium sediminis]
MDKAAFGKAGGGAWASGPFNFKLLQLEKAAIRRAIISNEYLGILTLTSKWKDWG